jgi:iron complex transport system ATP-binding protein
MGGLSAAVSIENLSFSYNENVVLRQLNAEIEPFCLTVILGKNGCGKSTLLKLIAGLLPYRQGEISFSGSNLKKLNLSARAKKIGFLGQKHKAVFPFTVGQVVLTGRAGYVGIVPKKQDALIAGLALEKVNISHLKNRFYTEISGGEQQLVMIARLLAQEPEILLLDEPTTHLDFCNQINLLSLLKTLTKNRLTVVAVLHDPNMAFLYGDDFIFMKNGKLLKPEPPVKPWDEEFLQSVFDHELRSIPYSERALIVPKKIER